MKILVLAFIALSISSVSFASSSSLVNAVTGEYLSQAPQPILPSWTLLSYEGVCYSGNPLSVISDLNKVYKTQDTNYSKIRAQYESKKIQLQTYSRECLESDATMPGESGCAKYGKDLVVTTRLNILNCSLMTNKYFSYNKDTKEVYVQSKAKIETSSGENTYYGYTVQGRFQRTKAYVDVSFPFSKGGYAGQQLVIELDPNKILNDKLKVKRLVATKFSKSDSDIECELSKTEAKDLVELSCVGPVIKVTGVRLPVYVLGLAEQSNTEDVVLEKFNESFKLLSATKELAVHTDYSSISTLWSKVSVSENTVSRYCVQGSLVDVVNELLSCGEGCQNIQRGYKVSRSTVTENEVIFALKTKVCKEGAEMLPATTIHGDDDCSSADKVVKEVDYLVLQKCK